MVKPARPANAPGYKCKANRDGTWREYWDCRTDIRKRGYMPANVRLHYGALAADREQLGARCTRLQAEMLSWAAHGGQFVRAGYSGTVASLAREFQIDPDSSFHDMKWNNQATFCAQLKIVVATVGERRVALLAGPDFKRWHRQWGEPREPGGPLRLTRARNCLDAVRRLMAWGMTQGWPDCTRADAILGNQRFKTLPRRESVLTLAHVEAIRTAAHAAHRPSIALAQVLQFELGLRQRDVCGEWEPITDAQGGIIHAGRRWCHGLMWSDIGAGMVLTKRTTKTGAIVAFDLSLYPSVLEEMASVPPARRIGPMVICETTSEPYKHRHFSVVWRTIADAAGLPRSVKNMDSRAGSITEAYAAGAVTSDIMKHAGHKDPKMSARYNREVIVQSSRVAKLRLAKREET